MTTPKLSEELYKAMDSFLVEGDKPRPIDRLNQDRHLYIERVLDIFNQALADQKQELAREIENLDLSLKGWCEFDDLPGEKYIISESSFIEKGYQKALKDVLNLLTKEKHGQ